MSIADALLRDINWRRIEDLPDELKDGRNVLLWDADEPEGYEAGIGSFGNGHWSNDEYAPFWKVTHFAAIEKPGDD